MNNTIKTCIYKGEIRHRRFSIKENIFSYSVFMMLVDIDNIIEITKRHWLWSLNKNNIVSFYESDYLTQYAGSLREKVDSALADSGRRPSKGKVFLLSNWRYFFYTINPISCFYCYNEKNELENIILEVTNTPWKERKVYVLDCDVSQTYQHINFEKDLHVSPFFSLDMLYKLHCNEPVDFHSLHLENYEDKEKVFDATLNLKRYPVSCGGLSTILVTYPMLTIKIFLGIYWQALKLFLRKVPMHLHPKKTTQEI